MARSYIQIAILFLDAGMPFHAALHLKTALGHANREEPALRSAILSELNRLRPMCR